ncbi:hypothetical protein [Inhella gelatinilytica]|uniref:Ubiquinone biosynthesis protein UbiJ n=1 Tax=Inhella gelatinilytica TaxID=2795030 RepID=A0A931NAI9_9BURK|nr:hypothetical protein [Inhella gelatinilytica]MBH9552528.1 hypothetical protein [Inhella gelatinilytica]
MLIQSLAPALQEQLILWLNHVTSREPVAMGKLKDFVGRRLAVSVGGAPAWAPSLPDLHVRITPAGLFERIEPHEPGEPALCIEVDASNPLQSAFAMIKGQREGISVRGDAALAGVVNWLFDNLRWDPADDVAQFVGPAPAHMLEQMATQVRAAVQSFLQRRP